MYILCTQLAVCIDYIYMIVQIDPEVFEKMLTDDARRRTPTHAIGHLSE